MKDELNRRKPFKEVAAEMIRAPGKSVIFRGAVLDDDPSSRTKQPVDFRQHLGRLSRGEVMNHRPQQYRVTGRVREAGVGGVGLNLPDRPRRLLLTGRRQHFSGEIHPGTIFAIARL